MFDHLNNEGLVSLIVPCYNAKPFLEECLESIRTQSYSHIQLIFVDDASTDGSPDVFLQCSKSLERKLSQVVLLKHSINQGQAEAINTALPYCNGEFLMWMDADDLITSENVASKVSFLRNHTELDMVRTNGKADVSMCGNVASVVSGEIAGKADKITKDIFDELLRGTTYCHNGCYMLRMSAFKRQVPEMRIPVSREGQNMQLLLPVASISPCGYIDECLFIYRQHDKSHSLSAKGLTSTLKRIESFRQLYLEILRFCVCSDIEGTTALINANAQQQRQNALKNYIKIVRK